MSKFIPGKTRVEYGGAIIGLEEVKAVLDVMMSQGGKRWTVGPESIAFEEELAKNTGVERAVVVNSGSSALLLAVSALKLKPGSLVAIPAVNFPTAFNAILQNNLVPYVVDVDPDTLLIDIDKVAENKYISAVIAVNIASNPVDLIRLRELVGKDVKIILDNCIAKGTLVKTENGDVPIEEIKVGDRVLTRKGYKKVTRTMYKGIQPVITRFGVTATPDHKFITAKGKKELNVLKPSDILYSCELPTTETNIIDIQNQSTGIKESIGTVLVKDLDIYTDTSGKMNTERYQKDTLYTTKTGTLSIMKSQILRLYHPRNILNIILKKMDDSKQLIKTSIKQGLRLLNGINPMMERSFILNTTSGFGVSENNLPMFALSAEKSIRHTGQQNQSTALRGVNQKAEVYDLTVEDAHEFFANGVLVSNCDGYGTKINGKYVEEYADLSCVSFHAAHIITTGEGGAVLTNDQKLADTVKKMREWGRADGTDDLYEYEGLPDDYRSRYVYEEIGYNLKPLELQCAMGRVQLKKIGWMREKRIANFKKMYEKLSKYDGLQLVKFNPDANVCWFSFPMLVKNGKRGELMSFLESKNIECRTIFSGNILRHPAYKDIKFFITGDLDNADMVMRDGMFLSVHPSITDEMIEYIDQSIGEFFASNL